MKVLFVFNHPAPYKVNFFNELAKHVDLTVIFERKSNKDRNKQFYDAITTFKTIYLRGLNFGLENNWSNGIVKHLKKYKYDLVIMNGYHTISEMLAINYLKKNKIPYVLYINGGIKKEEESNLKLNIKRDYISGANYYFSPDHRSNEYLTYYGANRKKIINYPYSTIHEDDILNEEINKKALRKKLNLPNKNIVISCGQFIERKNYATLLNNWKTVSKSYHLVLIGGGKQKEDYLNIIKEKQLDNVTILDFLKTQDLFEYFRASDVFIFPSKEDIYGHVVNEAMSQGLPILSSKNVNASLNLIEEGKNGFIYDPSSTKEMKDKLTEIINNLDSFSKAAIETSKKYTIEKMVDFHLKEFSKIVEKKSCFYLTTSITNQDYISLIKLGENVPNPSNQNFHSRLISSLSLSHELKVISARPLTSEEEIPSEVKEYKNITYYYIKNKDSLLYKAFSYKKNIYNALLENLNNKNDNIFVDTLNPRLVKVALKIRKQYGNKIIGIVTDNPYNLSKKNKKYAREVFKTSRNLDGYLCLTQKLKDLFNPYRTPSHIFEGIIDKFVEQKEKQKSPYFFFGGALYERYGVMDLINAFLKINDDDVDLIIAGHGPLAKKINDIAEAKRHIKFQGIISKDDMAAYEQHALASINPRRPSKKLENESIPSKVFEYISNKSLVVSTKNAKLEKIFEDNIIWTTTTHLEDTLKKVIKMSKKEREEKILAAYKECNKDYSYKAINKRINDYLDDFINSPSIE